VLREVNMWLARRGPPPVIEKSAVEPMTVAVSSEKSAEGHRTAGLTFHVNIAKAQFTEQPGARLQTFHMIAALFDADGTYVNDTNSETVRHWPPPDTREPTLHRLPPARCSSRE
jgi:hypothetical protein